MQNRASSCLCCRPYETYATVSLDAGSHRDSEPQGFGDAEVHSLGQGWQKPWVHVLDGAWNKALLSRKSVAFSGLHSMEQDGLLPARPSNCNRDFCLHRRLLVRFDGDMLGARAD